MKRKTLATVALALACAPVVRAQTVLFSDDFDAGTSLGRYTFFSFDRNGTVAASQVVTTGIGTFLGDTNANFAYDYTSYNARSTDPNDGLTPITFSIPSAPNTVGGTKTALRFDANNAGGGYSMLQALPKLTEYAGGVAPSGDHKLKFDLFIDYNGPSQGNGGSTEYFIGGINQDFVSPGGPRIGTETFGPGTGAAFTVAGERGNGADYRVYNASTRLDSGSFSTAYIATNASTTTASTNTPGSGQNQYYKNIFPFSSGYETPGGPGKVWNTVEISAVDSVIYYTINGHLIAARSDTSGVSSGGVTLGYGDILATTTGTADLDNITNLDANFALFDNVVVTQSAPYARPTWTAAGDGTWSNPGVWLNGVPDNFNTTADFTAAGSHTVTVDGTKTTRTLIFDSTGAYTLSGGTIVLSAFVQEDIDTNPGVETVALGGVNGVLTVQNGNHTIGSNIVLNSQLIATINQPGNTLTITGDLVTNNKGVTKNGPGTLVVKNIQTNAASIGFSGGSLAINAGKVRIAPNGTSTGVTSVSSLSIAAGTAALDITNNGLIINYPAVVAPAVQTTPFAAIQTLIKNGASAGFTGGGITSSTAATVASSANIHKTAIGYAEATAIGSPAQFMGVNIDATSIVTRYTYVGDADLTGEVNMLDFNALAANFNTASGANWVQGDFNYDGAVNALDFNAISTNFGSLLPAPTPALGTLVPEPGAMLMLSGLGLAMRRRGNGHDAGRRPK